MKTLCFKNTNISCYLFNDATYTDVTLEKTIVGDPVQFYILDMNSTTATMYYNVTAPSDWANAKYLFDGTTWTTNPDYIAPGKQT